MQIRGASWPFHFRSYLRLIYRFGPTAKDRKSTRLNSSHMSTSYAVFCVKKKTGATPGIPKTPPPPIQASKKAPQSSASQPKRVAAKPPSAETDTAELAKPVSDRAAKPTP